MALPLLDGGYKAISRFTNIAAGTDWTVSMDYVLDDQNDTRETQVAQAVRNAWAAWFTTTSAGFTGPLSQWIMPSVALTEVVVYALGGSNNSVAAAGNASTVGTSTADWALPPEVAMVMSKRTATRGRSGRGRFYMAGFDYSVMGETPATHGFFNQLVLDDMCQAFNDEFLDFPIVSTTGRMSIITPSQAPATGPWIPISRRVTSITCDHHPDTQRRRGRG